MNLANWLTVLRIILMPFFIAALIYQHLMVALGLFLLAVLTDFFDGFVARRTRVTTLGRFIDPAADKLLLVSAYLVMPYFNEAPVWVAITVVSRDVIITLGYLIIYQKWGSTAVSVRPLGKATTFIQSLGVVMILLGKMYQPLELISQYFLYLVAVVTAVSGFDYILTAAWHVTKLSEQKK